MQNYEEVTDPKILSQLNAPAQGSGDYEEVTDPKILAQLNNQNVTRGTSSDGASDPSVSERAMVSFLHQQSPYGPTKDYDPLASKADLISTIGKGLVDYAPYGFGAGALLRGGIARIPAIARLAEKIPAISKAIGSVTAENVLGGAGYGGMNAQPGDTLGGAALGGTLGAASSLVGGTSNMGMNYLAKKYAQSAIPQFTKSATDRIKSLLPSSDYANQLFGKFQNALSTNKGNWDTVNKTASDIDSSLKYNVYKGKPSGTAETAGPSGTTVEGERPSVPSLPGGQLSLPGPGSSQGLPVPSGTQLSGLMWGPGEAIGKQKFDYGNKYYTGSNFDNSPYHDYIDNYVNKINNMEPAIKSQYQQSLLLAKQAKSLAPESFSGMVAARQNLNSDLSNFLDPTGQTKPDMYSKQLISGLKDNLKNETLEANRNKLSDSDFNNFKQQWEDANQSHQNLQEFYKSMQPTTGGVNTVSQTRQMYQDARKTGTLDPSILNRYTPPLTLKGSQGVQGINQLGKLYGDPQTAQNAVQSALFRRPTQQGASTIDSAKIYSDMSPAQRTAVFGNSQQGQMLNAINNTRLAFGREPEKTLAKIGHGVMSWGMPGLIGLGVGKLSGEDWGDASMMGAATMLGAKGIEHGAGVSATPASVARAIKLGKASPFTGRYLNPMLQTINPLTGSNQ